MSRESHSIAIYVPALVGGGAERVAAVLASGLAGAGCDVTLIADFDAPENRMLVDRSVTMVTLGGGHLGNVLRLSRLLSRRQFDAVLAIGASANLKLVAAGFLARCTSRLILSYHGTSEVGRGLLGWLGYPLAPLLARRAARIVCVSDYLVRHLVERWRCPAASIVRIYNPVPVEQARPVGNVAELQARAPVIVALGRLAPEKDFASLITALSLLPGKDARLVIYGEGPDRDALRRLAERLEVADRTELPGYLLDPWQAYAQARCFALTSRSEAFGNVVVEALACGLPVVATDCGGPVEILAHGRHGEIVPVGQPAAIAAALGRVLHEPGDPAPRISRAQEFATAAVVRRYLVLLDDVIPRREAG
ncbi:MAG: glycosyltransferase [Hyphomicrobiales bacterium]|nr:glycosyltransferase [Hyphomicrobiales bacterium]